MTYQSEVLADAPWGYWRLAESALSTVANDSGSNGAAFTIGAGAVLGRPGLIADGGTAASSSGAAHIATLASIPAPLAGSSVTFEAWVEIPDGNLKGAFFDIGTVPSNGWAVGIGGSTMEATGRQLVLLHEAVAWKPTGYNFTTGTHHIVVTRSAADLYTIYVDGISVYTSTFTPNVPTGNLWVGGASNGGARALSASIVMDNVALYASALSSTRVAAHYNSGAGDQAAVVADAPAVWLKFDETDSFVDASGSGRNLAPSGTVPTLAVTGPVPDGKAVDYSTAPGYASSIVTLPQPTTVTYEVWVNLPSAPATQTTVLAVGGEGTYGVTSAVTVTAAGKVEFALYKDGDATIVSPAALTYGVWHHIVCSVGTAGAKIRIDGTTVASSPTTSLDTFTSSFVRLRGGPLTPGGGTGAMKIAEPAVWTVQLSDTRTDAHYAAAGPVAPSPVAVAGEPFTVATSMLDGAAPSYPVRVLGQSFKVTTSALDGVVVGAELRVVGDAFRVTTTTLDGSTLIDNPPPVAQASTDAVDRSNGRTRVCEWTVEVEPPVTSPTRDRGLDESQAYSISGTTLVDGRPT